MASVTMAIQLCKLPIFYADLRLTVGICREVLQGSSQTLALLDSGTTAGVSIVATLKCRS